MSRKRSDDQRHREYVRYARIAAALRDGPRTVEEISDNFYGYLRALGVFKRAERQASSRAVFVEKKLEDLVACGWVVRQGECYALTRQGREEVEKRLTELGDTGTSVRRFLTPQTVSKVTLGIHLGLAALKLPAGLLSGSVGLLNDAADTLLDGVSSLLVYLGLRFDKERTVNMVLVMFMLGTGGLTSYEAVRRFFVHAELEVDWYTFLAVILSAFVCLALWAYQRYVGLRGGSIAIITQSVDSRNHVIVAVSVTAGLIASLLQFPLLDTLVGLTVALLILKSAVELAIEAIRFRGEQGANLSRYKFGIAVQFERFRRAQLRDWMLYLVEKQGIRTRAELISRGCQALDFNRIPALQAMGLAERQAPAPKLVDQGLAELLERGWLVEEKELRCTDAGRKHLRRWG
jgi:ribosomal protein S19E (S16A)